MGRYEDFRLENPNGRQGLSVKVCVANDREGVQ